MKPHRRAIFLIVPLAILLLPLVVYGIDRAWSSDEIARNVTIAGVAVGGLKEPDASLAVLAHEQALRESTGVFIVNGVSFKLSPVAVGVTADTNAAIDSAMRARRDGNPIENFASWVASFSTVEDVALDVTMSETAIDEQLDAWEAEAIPNAAFEGAVFVADEAVMAEYPRTGEAIDRSMAHEAIRAEMSTLDKSGVPLAVITSEPILTAEDIEAAVAEMEAMIDGEVTLRSNEVGFRTSFSASQLASAARADLNEAGDALVVSFDEQRILEILEPRRGEYEIQPIDAAFDIDVDTDRIRVIPGRNGTLLDVPALLIELKRAALGDGTGVFPLVVGAEPAFTTEEAETYTSLRKLSEFTTTHPAREDRVTNIQQMARDVDGAIVQPGAEWSVNEWVGQRTEARGYIAAPAIINGEPYCCDHPANIGGGVSQFGTTIFNAIFYACLEDVEHRPHSLSFARYPRGLEATLGFPHPDVRFRNNTDAPVIIKTAYTDTSITVKMYGDNGGKTCTAQTSEPEQIVAFEEELVADTEGVVEPGTRVKERDGIDGYLVRVDRIVTYPDGREEIDLELVWRYSTLTERYIVHPCEVTGAPVNCPVKLPSLANATWETALATLQDLGLLAARVSTPVEDPDRDGVVIAQDPPAGEWVAPGSTITLTVGEFTGDADEDDG
ncbi:MAG TPA: VanW family protein [Acidimicrobiia bacterium]|nr:VanW family protein [Acidimicrobiia bacterium]